MTTVRHTDGGVPAHWLSSSDASGPIVPAARPGSWTRLAVTWHAAINYLMPIGYEDETGYHYGEMPVSNTATSLGTRLLDMAT